MRDIKEHEWRLLHTHGAEHDGGFLLNPILPDGADPWMTCLDSVYYYTQTTQRGLYVWRTDCISRLAGAEKVRVFSPPAPFNKAIWAPELHHINGRWYIYYAADDGRNENHRMFVAESRTSDPLGKYDFKGKLSVLGDDEWAIDGTILEQPDGSLYFVWSGWPGQSNGRQNLYISRMSDPCTLVGPRVMISTPDHAWEGWINEGPQILQHGGKTFIVFSAHSSWTDNYKLGLLTLTGGDPLDPASWRKHPWPVMTSYVDDSDPVYAPGHCSFVTAAGGNEHWIVYHAARAQGSGWKRHIMAQRFGFGADGMPHFGHPVGVRTRQVPPSLPVDFPMEITAGSLA